MAVKIICIKKDNGFHENPHVAISEIGWVNEETGSNGVSTRIQIYDFLMSGGIAFVVDNYGRKAFLKTATSAKGNKYVRTVEDETVLDNLLHLSECNKV